MNVDTLPVARHAINLVTRQGGEVVRTEVTRLRNSPPNPVWDWYLADAFVRAIHSGGAVEVVRL